MIDLLIIAVFVIYGIYTGFAARRRASKSLNEYFLAGRTLAGWRAGLSMAATQFAADTPLLVMGLIAVGGAFSVWRLWIYGLAFLLMGFVLGTAWRRSGVLTDAELTMIRYSARGALTLRALKAVYYGTVINCVVIAFVLVAAVRIFEVFLIWHEWLPGGLYGSLAGAVELSGLNVSSGITALPDATATTNNLISIVLTLGFVALYSTTGGLRSVVATDIVQLAFMLLGTVAYAWIAVDEAGGRAGMLSALQTTYGGETAARFVSFAPSGADAVLPFFVILALQWFYQMNSDGTGYLAQRTMACRDDRQARVAAAVFTFVQIVVRSLLWLLIGIALLVIFPFDAAGGITERVIAERELVFVQGMQELLPVGVRGLMLTAMLAALASTLDTHLNWGASYWSNDLYKGVWLEHLRRRAAEPRELVLVARLSNILILGIALLIMVNLRSIQTAWQISLLFGAGMGAVLVLRWLWERINLYCEIFAILTSLVLAPVLILTIDQDWLRLATMAAVSTAVVIASALWMPHTETHKLQAFYQRVRPPGWWRETAASLGAAPEDSIRALAAGFTATAACSVTVFAALIGIGKLLIQPEGGLGAVVALGIACAAIPFWLNRLRKK